MGEIRLLDCTLRDGGYVNDWSFGHENLSGIFRRLAAAGIDVVETGFLDAGRPYDRNRSIMPDTDCMDKIYAGTGGRPVSAVGMIDYGTCSLEHISPCRECFLDGIRVIFKKPLRKQALDFCAALKQLGYQVFVQMVSITSYSEEELLDLVRMANEVKPYAVSMVDTYGLLHEDGVRHYFALLDRYLDADICIGYHGHNNLQMAYANCIAVLSEKTDRTVIVDGSLYGMGKGAGNAPTELLAMYLNRARKKNYRIGQILEAVNAHIAPYYQPAAWGYSLVYFLSAFSGCHPNYAAVLMEKRSLSMEDILLLLGRLEGEKKLLFDQEYMQQLYIRYQKECSRI